MLTTDDLNLQLYRIILKILSLKIDNSRSFYSLIPKNMLLVNSILFQVSNNIKIIIIIKKTTQKQTSKSLFKDIISWVFFY